MTSDVLVFNLGQQKFALPVGQVSTLVRRAALTLLPGAPADLIGLLRLHGDLCPVIDIRARLGLSAAVAHIGDCIVIMHTSAFRIGLLVEGVDGVVTPATERIQRPGQLIRGVLEVAGHVVATLDAEVTVGDDVRTYLAATVHALPVAA